MCWVDSAVWWAGVGLPNADEAAKRRRRMWWDGRRSTEVPDREDSGTPWHPSCKWPSLAHPANEAHRGGVTSDRDRTSVCHWPHGRQHWALVAAAWGLIGLCERCDNGRSTCTSVCLLLAVIRVGGGGSGWRNPPEAENFSCFWNVKEAIFWQQIYNFCHFCDT